MPNMKRGVLLFNLGGPETLDDVRPFLYNLFSDPDIIHIKSNVARKMLAWVISTVRQGKSRDLYRQIGGGSPLRRITEDQAAALRAVLGSRNMEAQVYVGMRCWKPSIDDAVSKILEDRISQLVLLPLFPQYSVTTTGSCLKYFRALDQKLGLSSKMQVLAIESWCDERLYIESMAELIEKRLQELSMTGHGQIDLLYSAHSIPAGYVEAGDPFLEQTRRSVVLINEQLGNRHESRLAFQSKVGPVKWLGPSTRDVVMEMGRKGSARVLAIPISFVSDHIETLQEIDIQYKRLAEQSGIREFRRTESLNVYPKFIEALADMAARRFAERE